MDIKAMLAEVSNQTKGVSDYSLVDLLHKKLTKNVPARSTRNLHASAVTNEQVEFCPRQYVLMDVTNTTLKSERITQSLQVTFDYGRFLESKVQNDWFSDIIVGHWECSNCSSELVDDLLHKPNECCSCGGTYNYREVRVTSPTSGISCGLDGLVELPGVKKLTLLEIKTMNAEEWKSLRAPKTEHRIRTSLYLRVISETDLSEHVFTDEARILYVCKGYGGKHKGRMTPFKEYVIQRDDESTQFYYDQARLVHEYRAGISKKLPGRICNVSFCGRAQQCPVVSSCFSPKFID